MDEAPLTGGHINDVVRVGDTVRRRPAANAGFVHRLLNLLEAAGWGGAPRFLGMDEQGREVLSFVDGLVPVRPIQRREVRSDAALTRVAELVREFHDLTAGTDLAGAEEVVCHNDLSPANTVYRDHGRGPQPVAFVDWDLAAPGRRIHDLAHVCWQYLDLGPGIDDVAAAGRGIRLICDAYGLPDRDGILDAILWWQDNCCLGILAGAEAGDPAMTRLRDGGVVEGVRAARDWVAAHCDELW